MPSSQSSEILRVPRHVAIIMDGNGRWAESRRRPRLFGHKAGVDSVRIVVRAAREIGVRHLTLYAFSTENWRRPSFEVKGLMGLLKNYLRAELSSMLENDIRLSCLGQQRRLPPDVQDVLAEVMKETARCKTMYLNLALSYGSRSEIMQGVRELARRCVEEGVDWRNLDEEQMSNVLYTAGQPDPDLLIRTGGEQRLSNFLLWQLSYAELYFTEIKWPDFRKEQFLEAISTYGTRQRRFGRTGAQLRQE
ncbi:isoprenyl transferase [Desulfolithobacter sp.]